jgi:GH15 family glucan-1,4-alpha-glucosidase
MAALQIDFNVTDTFHIAVQKGKIRSVQTSSNDPKEYYEAKEWVKQNRSELIERPCEGIWEGGPTPCECILGMIKGFKAFVAEAK